jgi:hypothetical protein
MIAPPADDLQVYVAVDDARTAQHAGATFARMLAGADSEELGPEPTALSRAATSDHFRDSV